MKFEPKTVESFESSSNDSEIIDGVIKINDRVTAIKLGKISRSAAR